MKGLRAWIRDQRGTAGAEMALVTPLLVVLMFGSYELGNYFWDEHIVVKAVRDAARYAGRQSFSYYDCGAGTVDGTVATKIKNLARTGQTSGGTARLSGWTDSHVTVSVSCNSSYATGIYKGRTDGAPIVTVTAVVPYNSLFTNIGFDSSSLNIRSASEAAVMGI